MAAYTSTTQDPHPPLFNPNTEAVGSSPISDYTISCLPLSPTSDDTISCLPLLTETINTPAHARFAVLNARSASAHAIEIHDLLVHHKLSLLALTETWFNESSSCIYQDLLPVGYSILSTPRTSRTGGGVALISGQDLHLTQLYLDPPPVHLEYILAKGNINTHPSILFFCIYHPPGQEALFLEELQPILEELTASHHKIILCGDFNIHFNVATDPHAIILKDLLSQLQFQQHQTGPTHRLGNQLDLILNKNIELSAMQALPLFWADHRMLICTIDCWPTHPKRTPTSSSRDKIQIRNYKTLTPTTFQKLWFPCSRTDLPVQELDAIFFAKLSLARDVICPMKHIRKKTPVQLRNKWFSPHLQKLKTLGRALDRKWTKHQRQQDLYNLTQHHIRYKLAIKHAKKAYVQQQIQSASNSSRQLFSLAKQFTSTPVISQDSQTPSKQQQFCDGVAHYFHDKIQKIRDSLDIHKQVAIPSSLLSQTDSTPNHGTIRPPSFSQTDPNVTPVSTQSSKSHPQVINTDHHSTLIPAKLSSFHPVTQEQVQKALSQLGPSSSPLDPIPTPIMKSIVLEVLSDITDLINRSLTTGSVPSAWKRGIVTPLLKKPGATASEFCNYRPVTQLTLLARLTEHFITQQIQTHLEQHHILHNTQSGFRPLRSTEYAVADIRETLLWNSDQHHQSALVLLDLSAAFDTVQHSILLDRCEQVAGITGTAKAWLQSFLKDRTQQVKLGSCWSSSQSLKCGVPQGSSLSPVLFNIYVQPLAILLEKHHLKFQMYADDVQIVTNLQTQEREHLIPCLQQIKTWMAANYLQLNSQKTELMVVEGDRSAPSTSLPWPPDWGTQPTPVARVRNLGITFNNKGDGAAQASVTSKSCHHQLNIAASIFPLLDQQQRITIAQAWVGARLGYGSIMYLGASKKSIRCLTKVQNRAVRLIFALNRREHISPWRRSLGWLTISDLVVYRLCIWLWRSKNNSGPQYAKRWAPPSLKVRSLRSNHLNLLAQRTFNKVTKGGRSIGSQGAKAWNAIPKDIREQPSLVSFKRHLKAFLLQRELTHPSQHSASSANNHQLETAFPPSTFSVTAQPKAPTHKKALTTTVPHQQNLISSVRESRGPFPPADSSVIRSPRTAERVQRHTQVIRGVTSPPLPARNNSALIAMAAANKRRLREAGIYH